jgi:2-oxoglutarate dehydrogenase E1 component
MRGGPDRRGLRKPLIVMTAKSLLRHPKCVSTIDELAHGDFQPVVLDETVQNPEQIKRIQVCAGKVYYELLTARETRAATDTAIIKMPQLYPFPKPEFAAMLKAYPNAEHVVWVQEEPRNMGAWGFLRGRIAPVLSPRQSFGYAGRPESSSPAPGSPKQHAKEQADVMEMSYAPPSVARRYRKRYARRPKAQLQK